MKTSIVCYLGWAAGGFASRSERHGYDSADHPTEAEFEPRDMEEIFLNVALRSVCEGHS